MRFSRRCGISSFGKHRPGVLPAACRQPVLVVSDIEQGRGHERQRASLGSGPPIFLIFVLIPVPVSGTLALIFEGARCRTTGSG